MAKTLTRKQKKFVTSFVETGNGTQAALEAYDTEDPVTAGSIAYENLKKPQIQDALEEALPDELLAKVHREGLFATREIWKNNNESGVIELVGDEADFNARHKYLDSAYKLKGKYAAEKHLNVNVEVEASPAIAELTKKLNDVYRGTSSGSDGGATGPVGSQAQD